MSAFAAQVVPGSADWLARRAGCYIPGDRSARLSSDNNQQIDAVTDSPPSTAYQLDYKYPTIVSVKQDPDEMTDFFRSGRHRVADMTSPFDSTSGALPRGKRWPSDENRLQRDWLMSNNYHDNVNGDYVMSEMSEKNKYVPVRRLPAVDELMQLHNDVPSRGVDSNSRRKLAADEPVDLSLIEQANVAGAGVSSWNGHRISMTAQYVDSDVYKTLSYHRTEEQRHGVQRRVHHRSEHHEQRQPGLPPSPGNGYVQVQTRMSADGEKVDDRCQRQQMMFAEQENDLVPVQPRGLAAGAVPFAVDQNFKNVYSTQIRLKLDIERRQSPPELSRGVGGSDATSSQSADAADFNCERRQTWPLDSPVLPSWRRRLHRLEATGGSSSPASDTVMDGRDVAGEPTATQMDRFHMAAEGRSPISELIQLYDATIASRVGSQLTGNDAHLAAARRTTEYDDDEIMSTGDPSSCGGMDEDNGNSSGKKYSCHICPFVGDEKKLFDAHMKIHFDHWCPSCNYSSRTEGRLRCHIKMFHSKPEGSTGGENANKKRQKSKISCRHCDFTTKIKEDLWLHMRQHIPPEKMLECPRCSFVTDLKHHLEYHLRSSHIGSKPYKCDKCTYRCFNQSMLNSHAKSHTNVYQFRCRDCTFAAKYCHALKVHIRRYGHEAAPVLNEDGSQPTDGSGDFSLISRRGRPRGPRGQRDMPRFRSVRSRHQLASDQPMNSSPSSTNNQSEAVRLPQLATQPNGSMSPEMENNRFYSNNAQLAESHSEDGYRDSAAGGSLPSFSKLAVGAAAGLPQMLPSELSRVARSQMMSFPERQEAMMHSGTPPRYPQALHSVRDMEVDGCYIDESRHQTVPDELEIYSSRYHVQDSRSSVVVQPSAPPSVVNYVHEGIPSPVLEPEPAQGGDLPLDLTLNIKPKQVVCRASTDNIDMADAVRDSTSRNDCDDYDYLFRRRRDFRNWSKMQSMRQEPPSRMNDDDKDCSLIEQSRRETPSASPRSISGGASPNDSRAATSRSPAELLADFENSLRNDERSVVSELSQPRNQVVSSLLTAATSPAPGEDEGASNHSRSTPISSPPRDGITEGLSRGLGSPSRVASGRYQCMHCEIDFHGSRTLHAMHMAYHSNDDPFQCNVCGERTSDRVAFFLHLARVAHN